MIFHLIHYCTYRLKQGLKGESLYSINHSEQNLQEFLSAGGDPNLKIEGRSLLELNYHHIEMSRILLRAGAKHNPTIFFGLFDEFRENRHVTHMKMHFSQMLSLYLEYGANPNAVDSLGVSALRRCSSNLMLIEPLISFGAVPDALFFSEFMPFKNTDLSLYLQMGKNPDLQINGKFLLQLYCHDAENTQLLLEAGANTHLKNEAGESAHSHMIESLDIRERNLFFHYSDADKAEYKNRQSRLLELYLQYGSVENGAVELEKNSQNPHLIKPLLMAGAVPDPHFLSLMIESKNAENIKLTAEKMELTQLQKIHTSHKIVEAVLQKRMLESSLKSIQKSRVHKI